MRMQHNCVVVKRRGSVLGREQVSDGWTEKNPHARNLVTSTQDIASPSTDGQEHAISHSIHTVENEEATRVHGRNQLTRIHFTPKIPFFSRCENIIVLNVAEQKFSVGTQHGSYVGHHVCISYSTCTKARVLCVY